ncbi:MAG: sugar-binding protein [Gammaproteobacteria bacterium]
MKKFLLLLSFICAPLLSQEYDGTFKSTSIIRVEQSPVIDGDITDSIWLEAVSITDLHQIFPQEYDPATESTEVKILYTENAIYLAAHLKDSDPSGIIAQVLRQGERAQYDDYFSIVLSPFNDGRSGYLFEVNPNAVRSEALYSGRTFNYEWTAVWRTATQIDATGWYVEMEIPFSSLSFNSNSDTWGINFVRRIGRKRETNGWVTENRLYTPSASGEVVGIENIQQGFGLDIVPGFSLTEVQNEFPDESTDSIFEPTFDAFYKITPELTGVLTVNTDFSSTEADARQVNLTRFNLFFPEKRDFFLQDSDLFEFGRVGLGTSAASNNGRPFFSRRVGLDSNGQAIKLEGGTKISGRSGPFSIGLLAVQQGETEALDSTNLMVARVSMDVLEESDIGFIVTSGDPTSNNDNELFGFDFRYQNSRLPSRKLLESEIWYQETNTTGLSDRSKAYGFGIRQNSLTGLGYFLTTRHIEEDFNPAMGFVNKKGVDWVNAAVTYYHRPRDFFLRHMATRLAMTRSDRISDGSIQSEVINWRVFDLQDHGGDYLRFSYILNTEGLNRDFTVSEGVTIPSGLYKYADTQIELATGAHRKIYGTLTYSNGDFYEGTKTTITPAITWRPNSHLLLNTGFSINDVSLPQGSFTKELLSLRSELVFSNQLSWVTLAQWDNGSNKIGINSIFHWIPEAGRELFFVINNTLFDEEDNNSFALETGSYTVKVSYNIRF